MKLKNLPITLLTLGAIALTLSACGKTTRSASYSGNASGGGTSTLPTNTFTNTTSNTFTYTDTSTTTPTTGTQPALSYEFTATGQQAIATGNISTDNVLKVKFRVTAEQGNHVWKASELKVTLSVNGTEVTPTYTNSNYTYGRIGETSNVIDLSSYVTAGSPVNIVVKAPKNDFYCTYWAGLNADGSYVNPQYNSYPGCRKEVFTNHNWSGVVIVQTSSTVAI
ncbi:MAG: hypothetical protein EOP11_11875 [Proteobacteria bacterium]|nr:MAG: hypothetical protein EOP11_11875 [Pseudomonadota bacterium]